MKFVFSVLIVLLISGCAMSQDISKLSMSQTMNILRGLDKVKILEFEDFRIKPGMDIKFRYNDKDYSDTIRYYCVDPIGGRSVIVKGYKCKIRIVYFNENTPASIHIMLPGDKRKMYFFNQK